MSRVRPGSNLRRSSIRQQTIHKFFTIAQAHLEPHETFEMFAQKAFWREIAEHKDKDFPTTWRWLALENARATKHEISVFESGYGDMAFLTLERTTEFGSMNTRVKGTAYPNGKWKPA